MNYRILIIVPICFVLTSCSTFRPHVNPYKTHGLYCDSGGPDMSAKQLADYLRCEYTDILNDRITWDRGSGMAIAAALGLVGYRGIQGGHTAQVSALATGSASLYAMNKMLVNDEIAAVHAAGIEAVSCISAKYPQVLALHSKWFNSDSLYDQAISLSNEINGKIEEYNNPKDNYKVNICKNLLNEIDSTLYSFANSDTQMKEELLALDAKVKQEVDKVIPSIHEIIAMTKFIKNDAYTSMGHDKVTLINQFSVCDSVLVEKVTNLIKKLNISATQQSAATNCGLNFNLDLKVGDGSKNLYLKKGDNFYTIYNAIGDIIVHLQNESARIEHSLSKSNINNNWILKLHVDGEAKSQNKLFVVDTGTNESVSLDIYVLKDEGQ